MKYPILALLAFPPLGCDETTDDTDTNTDTNADSEFDSELDSDTSFDGLLCSRLRDGPVDDYTARSTIDAAEMLDLNERAARIALPQNGAFVGFEPEVAGDWVIGQSFDVGMMVIDVNGRSPTVVEETLDTGCPGMTVRTTLSLNAEVYWLLMNGDAAAVTLVADVLDDVER